MKLPSFKRFQSRLIIFFTALLVLLQVITYFIVNDANIDNAKAEIHRSLKIGADVFQRLLNDRTANLFQNARLLSADYAFKPAFYSADHGTILSAMENHLARIDGGQIMVLVDLERQVIASTLQRKSQQVEVAWPALIKAAENDPYAEATAIVMIEQNPFQLIVVPYFSPDISAWVIIGFAIDQTMANEVKEIINSETTFLVEDSLHQKRVTYTTHHIDPSVLNLALSGRLSKPSVLQNRVEVLSIQNEDFVSLAVPLDQKGRVFAILQRSLDQAMQPYLDLQTLLQVLFAIVLLLSFAAAVFIARRVTKPVELLNSGAKKIQQGDYLSRIKTKQKDELGQLAQTFNQMAKGLEEKEKVRTLLGKVVSGEIAEELLSKNIELGGEEKQATILFSDIRSFTSICEGVEAKQILAILNVYLTAMSHIIDLNHGVIDKYIGDAIMAMFGTPVVHGNDANNAVAAALAMTETLAKMNQANRFGRLNLEMGVGLNTGTIVAGNMGAPNRLNYTVIGDGVNLASRLESLTKFYGLPILASESTRLAAANYLYQPVDWVKVKGKQKPVRLFRPLELKHQAQTAEVKLVELSEQLLVAYSQRDWSRALKHTAQLEPMQSGNLAQIYRDRILQFQLNPPSDDWDASFQFTEK